MDIIQWIGISCTVLAFALFCAFIVFDGITHDRRPALNLSDEKPIAKDDITREFTPEELEEMDKGIAVLQQQMKQLYAPQKAPQQPTPAKAKTKPKPRRKKAKHINTSGFVYLLKAQDGYWKIGHTKNPEDRLKTFGVKLPFPVEYEHLISCQNRHSAESELHIRYAAQRIKGTEFFSLAPEQVTEIKSITHM